MLVRRPDRTFEILVPFESVPRQSTLTSHIREWRSAPAVAEWLARHAGGTAGIRQNGGFVYEIKATNRERALLVADALRSGRTLALARPADLAAELRVRDLLNAPRPALRRVEEHVRRTLRQLYRQRNIVLHAGATQPVALSACLRASAPLVGAGLDRITHAYLASGTKPLQIAARARLRLDLVGSNEGRSVVDLLE